jgi:cell division protein FtsN
MLAGGRVLSFTGTTTCIIIHYDQVDEVYQQRQQVLDAAYRAHPERFVRGKPTPPEVPEEVWINPPEREHKVIGFADPAAKATEPGAQAGSRATEGRAQRSLDADEHQAMVEKPLDQPDVAELFFPKFQLELSHNH